MCQKQTNRGQIFTGDAIFALVFVAALMGTYLSTAKAVSGKLAQDGAMGSLSDALDTSLIAIYSQDSLPHSCGLLDSAGRFSAKKIADFAALDAERSRELLGLYGQGGGYDFSLAITDFNGTEIARASSSQEPAAKTALASDRFGVLDDGRGARIRMIVWQR
jgi:hypothetical protein